MVQFDQNIKTAVSLTILIRLHTEQTGLAMPVCIKALKFLRSNMYGCVFERNKNNIMVKKTDVMVQKKKKIGERRYKRKE